MLALNSQRNQQVETSQPPLYIITAAMRVEMSETSDTEGEAVISNEALDTLRKRQYIQFFQTCGPTYVRSMYRAQEVAAIFQFNAASDYDAQQFAKVLERYVHGNNRVLNNRGNGRPSTNYLDGFSTQLDFDDTLIMNSLSIDILNHGLRLNKNGTEALVATSLTDFNGVMKSAFKVMTDFSTSAKGLLYGLEVVPWVDNAAFINFARLTSTKIRADTPYGLIENSESSTDAHGRITFRCSSRHMKADDFGKCCKSHELVMIADPNGQQVSSPQQRKQCQPTSFIPTSTMRDNLAINAEFVALLGEVMNTKSKTLFKLGQCVNRLRALPDRFDYFFLQASDSTVHDEYIDTQYTVKELKAALDPAGNLDIIKMVANENDEFYEMYYQPCLSALYGMSHNQNGTIVRNSNVDPKNFMAQPWYKIEECLRPSCLETNMVWDRVNGKKCMKGLLGRDTSMGPIPSQSDEYCARHTSKIDGEEAIACKHGFTRHANLLMQMDNCRQALPKGRDGRGNSIEPSIGYLMEKFCQPQVAVHAEPAGSIKMDEVDASCEICVSQLIVHMDICFRIILTTLASSFISH